MYAKKTHTNAPPSHARVTCPTLPATAWHWVPQPFLYRFITGALHRGTGFLRAGGTSGLREAAVPGQVGTCDDWMNGPLTFSTRHLGSAASLGRRDRGRGLETRRHSAVAQGPPPPGEDGGNGLLLTPRRPRSHLHASGTPPLTG